ncbi:MAG: putative porin, partial [Alphaproteobacteria bacterium]|nr:putative porin [Alphaproteobacteria bacterium]
RSLVTGDPDDPNSVDVTLSSFADDFQVSLDRVYAAAQLGDVTIVGGKFALPFARTDMVWDGDVSPQGAAISWRRKADADGAFGAHALFFPIDEDVGGADSRMLGGQVFARQSFGEAIRLDASLGYYDYRLRALASADAGDIRGNRFGGGRYLSDFDLVDAIVGLTYAPASRWPVTLRGNYVVNRGAPADLDTGYAVQLVAGTQAAPGDIRVSYGYSRVEQDAVFAAFSHDNTVISTGYVQHDLGLDYRLPHGLALNLSYYRFRPIDLAGANPWLNRLRLAALFSF